MTVNVDNLRRYVNKEPCDEALLFSTLQEMAQIVVRTYFSSFRYMEEDLISLGVERAVTSAREGWVDGRRNLFNCFYTGMRNVIGNYLRREKRYRLVEKVEDWGQVESHGICDLTEGFNKDLSEVAERVRMLGYDVRQDLQDYVKGRSCGNVVVRFLVRAVAEKSLK